MIMNNAPQQSPLTPINYDYHHGSGHHNYVGPSDPNAAPRYSIKCFFCNCIDCIILCAVILLLYLAITFALSLLDDSG